MTKKLSSTKHHIVYAAFIIGVLFFLGAGCGVKPPSGIEPVPPPPVAERGAGQKILADLRLQSRIKKFANTEELRAFLEERAGAGATDWGGGMIGDVSMMKSEIMQGIAEKAAPSSGSPDYSRANIQVEGVDEGDIAKTDGEYIYTISGNSVVIMKAYPTDVAAVVSRLSFDSAPQGLYIAKNRLIVYGYDNRVYAAEKTMRAGGAVMPSQIIRPGSSFTFIRIFDISDKNVPKQTRDFSFEGDYANSRMIGDYLYFVTNSYTYGIMDDTSPIPYVLEKGSPISEKVAPNVYYFDFPYQSPGFTNVSAVNIADDAAQVTREVYLLDASQTIYVSPSNLYLTYTKYLNEYEVRMTIVRELITPRLSEKDKERIQKIEAADPAALSREEKLQKINAIVERYISILTETERGRLEEEILQKVRVVYANIASELEKTVIHKIALNGSELEYQTFGEVPGAVLNQFSMDESGGYFRIATTKNRSWSIFLDPAAPERESYSNLYVLDSDLKTVGSLEGLAPGERIYSARFMQGRAYLVTFQQTDPLFVIDLAKPTAPRVLGELKIPGFSQYLHPYDDTTLIGFGRDTEATPDGRVIQKGLKLSLFDVSQVASPREINTYVFGSRSAQSVALYDHHAFLFSREKNLLALPFEDWDDTSIEETADGTIIGRKFIRESFRGAAVFSVTGEGFSFKGNVSHGNGYESAIARALYISDNLYALSNQYATIHKIDDITELKRVSLNEK